MTLNHLRVRATLANRVPRFFLVHLLSTSLFLDMLVSSAFLEIPLYFSSISTVAAA